VPGDLAAIEAIEAASLPWAAHWTSESYLCPPGAERWAFVAESGRGFDGFVLARWTGGEMEILNLAVDPAARGKGIGRALIRAAAAEGAARGAAKVFLEVRESNSSARAFYTRLGFAQSGRRPAYYREPDETAVLMARPLAGPAL
jgi:[ribosomal protein S18]-alanine N-acetyltransferase